MVLTDFGGGGDLPPTANRGLLCRKVELLYKASLNELPAPPAPPIAAFPLGLEKNKRAH